MLQFYELKYSYSFKYDVIFILPFWGNGEYIFFPVRGVLFYFRKKFWKKHQQKYLSKISSASQFKKYNNTNKVILLFFSLTLFSFTIAFKRLTVFFLFFSFFRLEASRHNHQIRRGKELIFYYYDH